MAADSEIERMIIDENRKQREDRHRSSGNGTVMEADLSEITEE